MDNTKEDGLAEHREGIQSLRTAYDALVAQNAELVQLNKELYCAAKLGLFIAQDFEEICSTTAKDTIHRLTQNFRDDKAQIESAIAKALLQGMVEKIQERPKERECSTDPKKATSDATEQR